ncbi:hypothetical protein [Ralstonia solanacearum]|uniref:hypothetical protein n=1 Tax=Ralstonia solanacearum TaxID=305 RepID=UPI0015E8A075
MHGGIGPSRPMIRPGSQARFLARRAAHPRLIHPVKHALGSVRAVFAFRLGRHLIDEGDEMALALRQTLFRQLAARSVSVQQ